MKIIDKDHLEEQLRDLKPPAVILFKDTTGTWASATKTGLMFQDAPELDEWWVAGEETDYSTKELVMLLMEPEDQEIWVAEEWSCLT